MKAKTHDHPTLTLGSRYHVRSLASREAVLETRGVFKGIVSVGTIDGLAMELDGETHQGLGGKMRVIPTHMVLSIDILEAATKEETLEDDVTMHYT